jgi:hypothetical protein
MSNVTDAPRFAPSKLQQTTQTSPPHNYAMSGFEFQLGGAGSPLSCDWSGGSPPALK